MIQFRKLSLLSVALILLVFCLPVLAEIMPERCYCCITTKCCSEYNEKKTSPRVHFNKKDLSTGIKCKCSVDQSIDNEPYLVNSSNISIKDILSTIEDFHEGHRLIGTRTTILLTVIDNHSIDNSLFLLKSSFLL